MKTLAISYYFSDFDPQRFWARDPSQPLWRRAVNIVGVWHDRSRQRRHLLELPDHLLRDISVTRTEVEAETTRLILDKVRVCSCIWVYRSVAAYELRETAWSTLTRLFTSCIRIY